MKKKTSKTYKGFTLIEMLVVVLIIGILAGIALPQYQMAVTKAKVASILPLMRRWKDALMEYKLQHGDYNVNDASSLGVNWPSDWDDGLCGNETSCQGEYWYCQGNYEGIGTVSCSHNNFNIVMYQPDESDYEDVVGMMTCEAYGDEGEKVCKALGGKLLEGKEGSFSSTVYKLN